MTPNIKPNLLPNFRSSSIFLSSPYASITVVHHRCRKNILTTIFVIRSYLFTTIIIFRPLAKSIQNGR